MGNRGLGAVINKDIQRLTWEGLRCSVDDGLARALNDIDQAASWRAALRLDLGGEEVWIVMDSRFTSTIEAVRGKAKMHFRMDNVPTPLHFLIWALSNYPHALSVVGLAKRDWGFVKRARALVRFACMAEVDLLWPDLFSLRIFRHIHPLWMIKSLGRETLKVLLRDPIIHNRFAAEWRSLRWIARERIAWLREDDELDRLVPARGISRLTSQTARPL